MKYKINKTEWNNLEHTSVRVEASVYDDEDNFIEDISYNADSEDEAELNKYFWNEIQKLNKEGKVPDREELLIIAGKKPVPKGYRVWNGRLYEIEGFKQARREIINQKLDELYSGRHLERAKRNPTYAKNREAKLEALMAVEDDPEFPFIDIEAKLKEIE